MFNRKELLGRARTRILTEKCKRENGERPIFKRQNPVFITENNPLFRLKKAVTSEAALEDALNRPSFFGITREIALTYRQHQRGDGAFYMIKAAPRSEILLADIASFPAASIFELDKDYRDLLKDNRRNGDQGLFSQRYLIMEALQSGGEEEFNRFGGFYDNEGTDICIQISEKNFSWEVSKIG